MLFSSHFLSFPAILPPAAESRNDRRRMGLSGLGANFGHWVPRMPDATDAAPLQWRNRIWHARSAQDEGRDAAPDRYYSRVGSQGLGTGKCQCLFMRGGAATREGAGRKGRPYIFIFVAKATVGPPEG